MKKILIVLSILVLAGCTSKIDKEYLKNTNEYSKIVACETYANTTAKGFKYYKPRDFSLLEATDNNHTLLHNSNKYFLSVDINAYHDKMKYSYTEKSDVYLSKKLDFNDGKTGYIEINEGNNSYFYIKVLYNYSSIEVSVRENEIEEALIDSMIILSSIRYNDNVIENIINEGDLDTRENTYEIRKPKVQNERTNILDVYDYGKEGNN